jgi:basic membrane protein A
MVTKQTLAILWVLLGVCGPVQGGPEILRPMRLAAIFSGPISDSGWSATAYHELMRLKNRFGFRVAYTENVKQADQEQILRDYAKAGFDVVMGHGFEFSDSVRKVALEYSRTRFVLTGGSIADVPNLYSVSFSAGEGGYFMGMIAAQMSHSGRIAYVSGTKFAALDHQIKMTRQAAKDLGKTLDVIESYIGNWSGDVIRAKELAAANLEQGADVLVLMADAADVGAIEAAKEAAAAGRYVRIIPWIHDKHHLAPELAIGGWEELVPKLIESCILRIQQGQEGGHFGTGLSDGTVALNPFYGLLPAPVEDVVRRRFDLYRKDPRSIPTLELRTDL